MNRCHACLIAALSALPAAGCATPGQDEPPTVMRTGPLQQMVRHALDDAARRSQRDVSTLKLVSADAVTWPDGSLGCPQPGMQYPQALVPGFRIRIQAGAQILEYHAGPRGQPFHCPAGRVTGPAAADPRT